MGELEDRLDEGKKKRRGLMRKVKELEDDKMDHSAAADQAEDDMEVWERFSSKLDDGQSVHAPSTSKSKKRSQSDKQTNSRKRRRIDSDHDSDVDSIELVSEDKGSDQDTLESDGPPLTRTQIDDRLEGLRQLKQEARAAKKDLEGQIRELKKEIKPENAEEEDPDNFDPDEDVRDYDQVARDLPVFCVSSRAYQKLSGRLLKDKDFPGFEAPEQTEIPQLQAHCKKLTENGRQASCRRFLTSLTQLLTSLGLWASDDGTGAKLSVPQRDAEKSWLSGRLKELEKALEKAVSERLDDVAETLSEHVFEKFTPAIKAAAEGAILTSSGRGAHKNDGGMYSPTYKATVRRSGVFQGAAGQGDLKSELSESLYKQLASSWEKAFQRRLPNILQSFTRNVQNCFRSSMLPSQPDVEKGHGVARIGLLEQQLQAYKAIFGEIAQAMIAQVNEGQREINREFTPVIAAVMQPS